MRLNDESRARLEIPMTLSQSPAGSTVELKIDDTWHPCTWQDSPVELAGAWTQTAKTTGYFAGPIATAAGATVLEVGRHFTETRVSWPDGDTIAARSSPIDVD